MWESFSRMISKWCQYGNRFFWKFAVTCPNGMSWVWDNRTYCIRQNTDSEDLKLLFLFIFLLLLLLLLLLLFLLPLVLLLVLLLLFVLLFLSLLLLLFLLSKIIKTVFVASRCEDGKCWIRVQQMSFAFFPQKTIKFFPMELFLFQLVLP